MNHCKQFIVGFLCCLTCISAFSQSSTLTVLTAGNDAPVQGAIIILKPLDNHAGKRQEIYFTNEHGEVINSSPYKSSMIIHCFGYKDLNDTIEAGTPILSTWKSGMNLAEVVVTGQYDINTSDKSVYNVKVIDENNSAMGAQNLSDALSNQLATRVSQDNILEAVHRLTASPEKCKNPSRRSACDRKRKWQHQPQSNMNNVERIEIIEGPMSVSYGTDALGGLINIVTKKSSSYPFEGDLHCTMKVSAHTMAMARCSGNEAIIHSQFRRTLFFGDTPIGYFEIPGMETERAIFRQYQLQL
jgi:hypothetical protein